MLHLFTRTLPQRIISRREKFGLRQIELARKAGICQQALSELELGEADDMALTMLLKICVALECSADYLCADPPTAVVVTAAGKLPIRIIARRRQLGYSQVMLSRRSGVSVPSLARIEGGHAGDVLVSTVAKVAAALGCTMGSLLDGPR